jgi:RNAse (barnase) inhibitor barstar
MHLTREKLLSDKSTSVYLVYSKEKDLDAFLDQIPDNKKAIIKLVHGENCLTTPQLFDEFSSVLEFPEYFGRNWDAFDECMTDLHWLKGEGLILSITSADSILSNEDQHELDIFLKIIDDAVKYWREKGFLKILFQTESEVYSGIKAITQKEIRNFDLAS